MRIRREQMDSLEKAAGEQFIDRIMAYLRQKQTDLVADLPDRTLRIMVTNGVARARRHGPTFCRISFGSCPMQIQSLVSSMHRP